MRIARCADGALVAMAKSGFVFFDYEAKAPVPMPQAFRDKFPQGSIRSGESGAAQRGWNMMSAMPASAKPMPAQSHGLGRIASTAQSQRIATQT